MRLHRRVLSLIDGPRYTELDRRSRGGRGRCGAGGGATLGAEVAVADRCSRVAIAVISAAASAHKVWAEQQHWAQTVVLQRVHRVGSVG
jgi:hypothetical protein